jgi:Zn finger protein HypA/HybF involved in hydrogenase expression
MSIFKTLINWYRSPKKDQPLYKCVDCGETAPATTSHVVCPECEGKLERIELVNKS